ncbi:hypothetical protein SAMN04489740_2719 [Arthrobacter alpinus]|uniref:Uncharacterized protein n=1 Tax=Arthrobacter alpinus TaxID=656366 RepID=A0A1H5M2F6_9MICC|nr:hypothetical protein [Arthrobacter alpinus]SEE83444.1 hypothetical protein SAMN04489740_2719 [Arthrobacter alpinus]
MARDRANINTNIWTDTHWRQLTRDQQWLYELLLTHPELSYAGVSDWRPGRLMQFSAGTSRQEIERIGAELQAERFIFIDEDTEEVLIRSFLRHDGILKQPKLTISMVNAYAAVSSNNIREVIVHELNRLYAEAPGTKAFENTKVLTLLKQPGRSMDEFTLGVTPAFTLPVTPTARQTQALPTTTATTTATKKKTTSEPDGPDDVIPPRFDVQEIIDYLSAALERNDVRFKVGKSWHVEGRRLIDIDKYTVEQIKIVIRYATTDSFWKTNIMSMSTLRAKFEQLKLKAQAVNNQTAAPAQVASQHGWAN